LLSGIHAVPAVSGVPKSAGSAAHAAAPSAYPSAPAPATHPASQAAGHAGPAASGSGPVPDRRATATASHNSYAAARAAVRYPHPAATASHLAGYSIHIQGQTMVSRAAVRRFDEHVRDPARERDIARLHGQDFPVRDVRGFTANQWRVWRGGAWRHEYYDGRFGWWYAVGGVYYPYLAPIYPYPLVVAALVYTDLPADPPLVPVAPLRALPHVAYHCASPDGFYPALPACDGGWIAVHAGPDPYSVRPAGALLDAAQPGDAHVIRIVQSTQPQAEALPTPGEQAGIEIPPVITFTTAHDVMRVINPTAVYLKPDRQAPQAYKVGLGTLVYVIARSTDGTWSWVNTADNAQAYIPSSDIAPPPRPKDAAETASKSP